MSELAVIPRIIARNKTVYEGSTLRKPLGYTNKSVSDKTPVLDPTTAPKALLCFILYLHGFDHYYKFGKFSSTEVGGILGIHGRTVQTIIRNPFYIGDQRWAGEVISNHHESLLPENLFYKAQSALTIPQRTHMDVVRDHRRQFLQGLYDENIGKAEQLVKLSPEKRSQTDYVYLFWLQEVFDLIDRLSGNT
jgi:hypothetical protein